MPLSKKLRFEVFKRDGFTCAYCGRKPPTVTLEVDHILARAAGEDATLNWHHNRCKEKQEAHG